MVSFCRKRGSVRFIEPRRTLAFGERGVFVDQIVHVTIDTVVLVSKLVEPLRIHLFLSLVWEIASSTHVCRTAFP